MTTWTELFPAFQAASRRHSMAEDTNRHRIVDLGADDSGDDTGKVQEWDGTTWAVMATRPGDGFGVWKSSAFDPIREEVVAFGGTDLSGNATDNTHVCDSTGTWILRTPANAPSPRFAVYMAWVPALAGVVAFGGSGPGPGFTSLGDTWLWDGTDWTELFPALSPSARVAAQGSNQAATVGSEMMIYSSSVADHETWILSGVPNWRQETPSVIPTLDSPSLCLDPNRNTVILLGKSGGVLLTYIWPVAAPDWSLVATTTAPSSGLWHALAFDDNLNKMIAAGANAPGGATNPETWELDVPVEAAIRLSFGLGT